MFLNQYLYQIFALILSLNKRKMSENVNYLCALNRFLSIQSENKYIKWQSL